MAAPMENVCDELKSKESSSESNKRPQFGNRLLDDNKDVFQHNAWDNVVWDDDLEEDAKRKVSLNSEVKFSNEKKKQYEADAALNWDKFYDIHQNRFFKDRHWLFTEFPELSSNINLPHVPERVFPDSNTDSSSDCRNSDITSDGTSDSVSNDTSDCQVPSASSEERSEFPGVNATYRIFEVGCGAGNTVYPVLQANSDPGLFVYCCDFSSVAVDIVRQHPDFDEKRCHPFVCDVSRDDTVFPFPAGSLDVIVMIFVLSAIEPLRFESTIKRLADLLKPGGLIVMRDYGRYDMAQLRFKNGQCIDENFYARGDGTRCYFFTQEELRQLMLNAGLEEVQNLVDRRLQVNRGRQLKMYRVWVQCKYRKPLQKSS